MGSQNGKMDAKALLGVLRGWLFNYNTVEQLMLFSAGIVCVMGMMFAAQTRKSSTYRESRDAVTSVVILVVAISIIYLFTVFVVEVVRIQSNRRL
jgi:nitric oxide reductase large subunit